MDVGPIEMLLNLKKPEKDPKDRQRCLEKDPQIDVLIVVALPVLEIGFDLIDV